ncbi:unnamed protein product [Ilex paraguariensis]|uniref:Uncharacterized protein n=1 Tax=Ilex paraguariensis TaxID=185542 RepID=A0ABC8S185_9AQUA
MKRTMSNADDFKGAGYEPIYEGLYMLAEAVKMFEKEKELIKKNSCQNIFGRTSLGGKSVYEESLTDPILPLILFIRQGKRSLRKNKSSKKITFIVPDDAFKGERLISEKFLGKPVSHSLVTNLAKGLVTEKMIKKPDTEAIKACLKRRRHERKHADQEENRAKKKVKRNMTAIPEILPLPLPVQFKNLIQNMGGSQEMLIIQKPLYKTDLSRNHGRLSIPRKQIKNDFLTPEEKMLLNESELKVKLIEPCLDDCYIHLRKWEMKTSSIYVLVNIWNEVLSKNGLEEDVEKRVAMAKSTGVFGL